MADGRAGAASAAPAATAPTPIAPVDAAPPGGTVAERVSHWMRPGTLSLPALPPLSLYIHLPWCIAKCPYCDFNSHAVRGSFDASRAGGDAFPERRYIDALVADLDASLPFVWGRPVHTVFLGGGTPSLFSPDAIARLIGAVRARLPLDPGCEITLEANPGSFERDRFRAFRAAGVTRLSVGVQSFDDARLAALGRVHDAAQAHAAVAEAAAAFDTWNLDLMVGLPGQEPEGAAADVAAARGPRPPHLSLYQLTIEPNTLFAARPPALPDDDAAATMLDLAAAAAEAAGLDRYEVSAYARPGHRAQHNLNYWRFGDYLGIGAGAHGKVSFPHHVVRQVRLRDPAAYMAGAEAGRAVASEREVKRRDLPFEFMLNALRLRHGFELETYVDRTGLPLATIEPALADAEQRGLVERDFIRVVPTALGYAFLNDLFERFLPPAA